MAETAAGSKTQTIDQAIEQIETLYRSVTGQEAPPVGNQPYAGIPPEREPEQHVAEQIDRLLDVLGPFTGTPTQTPRWIPPMSVWESPEEILIRLDLPGIPRHAAKVTTTRGLLEVTGRRSFRDAEEESNHHRLRYMEQCYGEFRRSIALPLDAETDHLEAQMREGVLEIRVPKSTRQNEARTIPVDSPGDRPSRR
jgi:HSP20 family protein